jgi:serine/threonine protein kinase
MGVVYRARDTETEREVALKILAPTLASNPVALERFRREARQGVKLRHENLVSIYELGEATEIYFLAQEFVEGVDLHEYITQNGGLDPDEARELLTQAARALDYLHRQRVVHRDIKPANFLLTHVNDKVILKLTDLGLAREARDEDFRVTRTGNTVGTIDYMAPEQARDSSFADIRSDIYSLGCTFYHMLAGQPPFPDGGLTERLYKHIELEPPDVREFNPQIPPGLVFILKRMLAKKPQDRYQSPAEILDDLFRLDRGDTPSPALNAAAAVKEEALRLQDETERPQRETGPGQGWRDAPTQITIRARPDGFSEMPVEPDGADSPAVPPAANPEHSRIAAVQFVHAQQCIGIGNYDYAIHLLLSCSKLHPGNLIYRQILRHMEEKQAQRGSRRRWFGWITTLALKAKLKAARKSREYVKVLERGEDILALRPNDVSTQLDMAEAAERLGFGSVALWLLEHVWGKKKNSLTVNRALARLYEKQGYYRQAAAVWKLVLKKNPTDPEAYHKTNDLAARDTIVRGRYQQLVQNKVGTKLQ